MRTVYAFCTHWQRFIKRCKMIKNDGKKRVYLDTTGIAVIINDEK